MEYDRVTLAEMREEFGCEPCADCDNVKDHESGNVCQMPHARPYYGPGVPELWEERWPPKADLSAATA